MLIYPIIYSLTIAIQSSIIMYKLYEKQKIIAYIFNILILFLNSLSIALIIEYPDIELKIFYIIIFFIIANTISIINLIYKRRKNVGKVLIKHTIDASESGIIAFNNKNRVLFQNSIMYGLMEKLNVNNEYVKNISEKAVEKIGNDYIVFVEDKVWLFCVSKDNEEITAFNIDEEYKLQKQLEKQNAEINKNNAELLWTIQNLETIEKEEKSLKIKNKFHDVLGQNLAILKMYLNQNVDDENKFNEIKFMIKKMFTELEDSDDPNTNLNNLVKVNNNLGIQINIQGKLPEDKEKAKVIFEIIREAVTNAIRHANSTKVNIKIEDKLSGLSMLITNNGNKPKEIIIENEGIKGMRRKLKKINGNLFIKTVPEFSIRVDI